MVHAKITFLFDLQIMARLIFDRKIDHDDWWFSQNITI
jgi:hypothetical protein